jgi:hypothetical protein
MCKHEHLTLDGLERLLRPRNLETPEGDVTLGAGDYVVWIKCEDCNAYGAHPMMRDEVDWSQRP